MMHIVDLTKHTVLYFLPKISSLFFSDHDTFTIIMIIFNLAMPGLKKNK